MQFVYSSQRGLVQLIQRVLLCFVGMGSLTAMEKEGGMNRYFA